MGRGVGRSGRVGSIWMLVRDGSEGKGRTKAMVIDRGPQNEPDGDLSAACRSPEPGLPAQGAAVAEPEQPSDVRGYRAWSELSGKVDLGKATPTPSRASDGITQPPTGRPLIHASDGKPAKREDPRSG